MDISERRRPALEAVAILRRVMAAGRPADPLDRARFLLAWEVHGREIRRAVPTDAWLAEALRLLLPPYTGPGGLQLFRAEMFSAYKCRRFGFSWTRAAETAQHFARPMRAQELHRRAWR